MARIWLSAPLGHGFRTGVSINPGAMVSRQLTTRERLSPTGRQVGTFVFAPLVIGGMLIWMAATYGHWNETWLEMLVVYLLAIWIIRKILLNTFPRDFEGECADAEVTARPVLHQSKLEVCDVCRKPFEDGDEFFPTEPPVHKACRNGPRLNGFGEPLR